MPTRRAFLKTAAGGALLTAGGMAFSWSKLFQPAPISGELWGPSSKAGHLLRDGSIPFGGPEKKIELAIIGGGIAGLSAAWWLKRNGFENFRLFEIEPEVGGSSRSGENAISAYPWGAHYLPIPSEESRFVKIFLEELGVIRGYEHGLPVYEETYLCADPQERLLFRGRWQEGLVPQSGITQEEHSEYRRFFSHTESWKRKKGRDGRPAFAIPLEESSHDPEILALDRISMKNYLDQEGFLSPLLHWYVNYCCRDDYGQSHSQVSAWAGLHYFASRTGKAANAPPGAVLTWPEGNGWLVRNLRSRVSDKIQTSSLCHRIQSKGEEIEIGLLDLSSQQPFRVRSKHLIFAAPRFSAKYLMRDYSSPEPAYAPWLVANISLNGLPTGRGAPLSWDNVSFSGRSLGYIVATHQNLGMKQLQTVLTFYQPLDQTDPASARREARDRNHSYWAELVASEMEKMHPGIRARIQRIDVWIWGHAMASPGIGFIWGKERKSMLRSSGRIHFAHSDISGISLFEEAQYRGILAAQAILKEWRA